MFKRYQSIKKYQTMEVEGIELGKLYVFPKLDGTNSSIWMGEDDVELKAGSRNRELTLDNDNAGFLHYLTNSGSDVYSYLREHPTHRLFGEWLVPHTLKTYDKDAWRKFYVFDVMVGDEYINYDIYKKWLEEYGIRYIPAICSIMNASSDRLYHQLENSNYLIKDGDGLGEGIVLKNYDFVNSFGNTVWAKIVRADFKQKHSKEMGHPEIDEAQCTEFKIVEKFIDSNLIEKEYAKIVNEQGGWDSKFIPRLFNIIYYELIHDDMWEILKEFKNPTINFKALKSFTVHKIKMEKKELFS